LSVLRDEQPGRRALVLELRATARTSIDRTERRIAADDAGDEPTCPDIDSGPHDAGDARAEPDADADRSEPDHADTDHADTNHAAADHADTDHAAADHAYAHAASERTRFDTGDDDATGPRTPARDPGAA
jgi:hypothetical protein